MSLRYQIAEWVLPQAVITRIWRAQLKARKDMNEYLSPVQLHHVCRYQFAKMHIKGNSVLDAACGAGYGSALLEPVEKYVGIDYADYCVRYAKEKYGEAHRSFIEGDLYSLTDIFPRRSFDTIVSFETLEHLDNPERILSSFCELLKPNGRLIMSIPLNHPDLVYHKRKYTHEDIHNLLIGIIPDSSSQLKEYLQEGLLVTPLKKTLPPDATGTWLGVLIQQSTDYSQQGVAPYVAQSAPSGER